MSANPQIALPDWNDPIVQELHAIREKLAEKFQGDLHAYSEAARARALALGFRFTSIQAQPPSPNANLPAAPPQPSER